MHHQSAPQGNIQDLFLALSTSARVLVGMRERERERHNDEFISSSHSLPFLAPSAASPPTHSTLMFRPSVPPAQSSASSDFADLWPSTLTPLPREPLAVHSTRDFTHIKRKTGENQWTVCSVREWKLTWDFSCVAMSESDHMFQCGCTWCILLFSEAEQALYRKQKNAFLEIPRLYPNRSLFCVFIYHRVTWPQTRKWKLKFNKYHWMLGTRTPFICAKRITAFAKSHKFNTKSHKFSKSNMYFVAASKINVTDDNLFFHLQSFVIVRR